MRGEIGVESMLDYAVFQISSTQNSYEALICSGGKMEKLACGPLDQLVLHLPQAKELQSNSSCNNFKLELGETCKGSSWFTKFTLARFLHIINSPDAIRSANVIANEMSQLEDTKIFHLTLYSKDHPDRSGGITAGGHLKDVGSTQDIKVETGSSDATKNELLRAMELRLVVLKEELKASFSRPAGVTLSVKQISDLAAFAQHFEVRDLRDPLSKYLSLIPEDQLAVSSVKKLSSADTRKDSEDIPEEIHPSSPEFDEAKPANNGISPAKIAQAERQSSTESENSSESGDEDQTFTERSRPVMRSATPRRSASPMRRIQIGRSGSRRSTALTIKSLSYFPAREKITSNRDADENNSGDDEVDQPAKKPENTVRRMSVQEAISLFESKQKDQNLDVQKRKASGEVSLSTNKTVLRRWSAGMSDSLTRSHENASEAISQNNCANLVPEAGDNELTAVKVESDFCPGNLNAVASETAQIVALPEAEMMIGPSKDIPVDLVTSKVEEIDDKATASAEWGRQKEEELNQMLMKMMESRPGKYRGTNAGSGALSTSNEQSRGFCSQYKAKRDEKLRPENVKKHSVMEVQLKVLKETLKPSKVELASKSGTTTKKLDQSSNSQRPRRNSSPPVLNKKEVSQAAASKKASPKSSPLPTTRGSWSSGSLQKMSGTQLAKTSPRVSSANTTPSRRKSQPTTPTPASPKTERPLHHPKGKLEGKTDVKPTLRGQGEKKQKTITKLNKMANTKAPSASGDDSGSMTAKPSFYNKVTKKSSVVPLEAKPFLKKGTGIGPRAGPVMSKNRVNQSDDSSKISDSTIQAEEKEPMPETTESTAKVLEVDLAQQANDVDENLVTSLDNNLNLEKTENVDQSLAEVDNGFQNSVELPVAEIQPDEDIGISSAAWVEVEHQEVSTTYDTGLSDVSVSTALAPLLLSSPRVRHSLSQMLQADSNEPDIIEWGNAENPPALIYHKDAPKGLKRLLKFARKSKGEANVTGWASPSVFSEGEDDTDDSKAANRKNLDISRKTALQAKGYDQQKSMLSESLHDGNSSKRAVEYHGVHDVLSGSDKFPKGHVSSTATSTKARSFFSLSTFRSSKSNETKPR